MDPVTNSDRIIALLRQRLKERGARRADDRNSAKGSAIPKGLDAVAASRTADIGQLRRACVQTLLSDRLGTELLNDAQFQQIVTRVTDAIADDRDATALLDQVLSDAGVKPIGLQRR